MVAVYSALIYAQFPNCSACSFLGVYLRATRIVVLFVDRIYAKTLHFLAEPVHLDAAWAEPSAIDGTLIQEIVNSKWTGEVAVLYRSADSAQLRNTLNHRTMR